ARDRAAAGGARIPLLLKIAPDLSLADLDDVVGVARARRIDGMIVGNTTVARPANLRDRAHASEAGGLSGRPLFRRATRMLAETFVRVEGKFPLIGTGGIDSGAAAFTKIKAGATLIQLYTGLVFRGVHLATGIKADLVGFLRLGRHDSLAAAVGLDAAAMTAEPWPEELRCSAGWAERLLGSLDPCFRRRARSPRGRLIGTRPRGLRSAQPTLRFSFSSPNVARASAG